MLTLPSITSRIIVIALLYIASSFVSQAQELDQHGRWINGVSEPWWFEHTSYTKEEADAAIGRWQSIEAEYRSLTDKEWSGSYFVGDETHGAYLRWAPQSGFIMFVVDKCQAKVMNIDFGKAMVTPTLVRFDSERKTRADHTPAHEHDHSRLPDIKELLPVKWQGNRYLIKASSIADFCDYTAGLGGYNEGLAQSAKSGLVYVEFFVKGYKERVAVEEELPIVPPAYERHVKRAVEATISGVGRSYVRVDRENPWWNESVTPVTIDAGTADGVKPQMTLYLPDSERMEVVKVRRTGGHSSRGEIVRYVRKKPGVKLNEWDDGAEPEYPLIMVGLKLSTSPHR